MLIVAHRLDVIDSRQGRHRYRIPYQGWHVSRCICEFPRRLLLQTIRIVLAEDHKILRSMIKKIIHKSQGIQVVGEAQDGIEALRLANELNPDILLLDINMPVMDGIDVIRLLCKQNSPVRILVLSAHCDPHFIAGLLALGGSGYLSKDEAPCYLIEAIHRLARGETGWFIPDTFPQPSSLLT
jgi:DNA-binding NarL/FixJ family response regulator